MGADRKERLLSDLTRFSKQLPYSTTTDSGGSPGVFDTISEVDFEDEEMLRSSDPLQDDLESLFNVSGESTDSEEDNLQLAAAAQLERWGVQCMRAGQHEQAVRYLNAARLDWTEAVARDLRAGLPIQEDSIKMEWLLSKWIQIATLRKGFVERADLLNEYEAIFLPQATSPELGEGSSTLQLNTQ